MSAAATNFWLLPAPVSVLALLASAGATALLLAGAAVARLLGKGRLALALAGAGVALPVLYGAALFLVGLATPDRTVPVGQEKALCEIDCHLVYSVTQTGSGAPAGGRSIRVLRLLSRFDETTTAPWRGNSPLSPNPRRVELLDALGRRFVPVGTGWRKALAVPLRPGESYGTDLAFEVPADARSLRLFIGESEWPARLLLGNENAPLAGRACLALPF